jgi:hypothetical protein
VSLLAELKFPCLISLELSAYFSSSRCASEYFIVNCSHTLASIKEYYKLASEKYNLKLLEECTGLENRQFSKDFTDRLLKFFPYLASCVDFECIGTDDYSCIYLLICTLENPKLYFEFVQLNQITIGGEGLF